MVFQGRPPLDNVRQYSVMTDINDQTTFYWFPSFEEYFFWYRIADILFSISLTIFFYYIAKKINWTFIQELKDKFTIKSLSTKMTITFLFSSCIVVLSLCITSLIRPIVFECIMDTFYQKEDFSATVEQIQKKTSSINLNEKNKEQIKDMIHFHNNHVELLVYDENGTYFIGNREIHYSTMLSYFYDSIYDSDTYDAYTMPLYYDYSIPFKNQTASLIIVSYPLIQYTVPYLIISVIISFSFYIMILQSFVHRRIHSIQKLQENVFNLTMGNYDQEFKTTEQDEMGQLSEDLEQLRITLLQSMENEKQAKDANRELISSLSHDLRTPLTTLRGYLEIVQMQNFDSEKQKLYLLRCLDKVEEIKELSNKMFEYSLVFSTEYKVQKEQIPISEIVTMLNDHIQYLNELDLKTIFDPIQTDQMIYGNKGLLQRIFNNIFSNIQKYCDPWKEIHIHMEMSNTLTITFSNAINQHLEQVESNKIGLKSTKEMMELQEGKCLIQSDDKTFTVILSFASV